VTGRASSAGPNFWRRTASGFTAWNTTVGGRRVERHPDADLLVALHRQEWQVLVPRGGLGGARLLGEDLVVEEDDLLHVGHHLARDVLERAVERPCLERVVEHPREGQREEPWVAVVGVVL
jgi:hypothetical protein